MIFVPLKYLKSGMTVAKDIHSSLSFLPLLVSGQALTDTLIYKLTRNNVQGVYIESNFGSELAPEEFLTPEFKQKTMLEMRNTYAEFTSKKEFSTKMLNSFTHIAEDIIKFILSKDECLFNIIDIKDYDTYTYTHSMYVSILSAMMGIKLGYSQSLLTELALCGLLHDTGKVDVPIEIINKTTPLTDTEFEMIKTHPTRALLRLKSHHQISMSVLMGIGNHHEKFDGTGYPAGLSGFEIPEFGRILALADVYDALTSERPYRQACTSGETIEYMLGCADSHFDIDLLQIFLKTVVAYPVGTILKLSNGNIAVVTQNSSLNILRPQIRVIFPLEQQGVDIDLASSVEHLNVTIEGIAGDELESLQGVFS